MSPHKQVLAGTDTAKQYCDLPQIGNYSLQEKYLS
jgi:hypothetical protein